MSIAVKMLIVDDNPDDARLMVRKLRQGEFVLDFRVVDTEADYLAALEWQPEIIVSDFSMPQFDPFRALRLLRERGLDIPFIVVSGTIGEELAVKAMREGASDYLMKDKLARLGAAIERELEEAKSRQARRQAEEDLARLAAEVQQQRDRLNTIISSVPGLVWEAWAKPDAATRQVDFVSDYVQTMLGYTAREWLSKPRFWLSIVHPDDRDATARAAAANFVANKRSTQQFRWVAKDGRVLWVESTYSVIADEKGEPAGMVGVTVDVSERRRAEDALRESEAARTHDLAEANERLTILDCSKNDFLNLISHEFRTPLNGLLGVGELILMASTEEDDELRGIFTRSRQRILSILDDALLLTRIDVTGKQFSLAPVSLDSALSNAIEKTSEFAKHRRVALSALPAGLDLVLGDERLLAKALHVLLETAVKFSKEGETIRLSRDTTVDSVRIIVESQGRTIPGPALAKFFEIFSTGDGIVPGGDLGLGPPVAYRILSLFGASISVENLNPPGIRLTISLKDGAANHTDSCGEQIMSDPPPGEWVEV